MGINLKPLTLLLLAAIAGISGYAAYSAAGLWFTQPDANMVATGDSVRPELEWLRQEFQVPPAQFVEVTRLDQEYAPRCAELCDRVRDSHAQLATLAASPATTDAALQAAVEECSQVEADCRNNMLQHLAKVGQQLAPAQRERFLAMMSERLLRSRPLAEMTGTPPAEHAHHSSSH